MGLYFVGTSGSPYLNRSTMLAVSHLGGKGRGQVKVANTPDELPNGLRAAVIDISVCCITVAGLNRSGTGEVAFELVPLYGGGGAGQ